MPVDKNLSHEFLRPICKKKSTSLTAFFYTSQQRAHDYVYQSDK